MCLQKFQTGENTFQTIKQEVRKVANGAFFGQNLKFFLVFNLVKIGQENLFDDILERKKAFLQYENTKLKKSKHWDFSKKLVKIGLENVFKDILGSKKVFLDHEHRKLEKRRKIGIFPYSIVYHFGEEFETFRSFQFSQNSPGKCV